MIEGAELADGLAAEEFAGSPAGPYVGLASRTIAFVLDAAAINLVALIVEIGVSEVLSLVHVSRTNPVVVAIGSVAYVLWTIGYFVGFWCATGETIGDRVMRLRVITTDGALLGPWRAFLRFLGLILSALLLFTGYLMILFDSRRRALHDHLAGTVVVESPTISLAEHRRARRRAERSGGSPHSGDEGMAVTAQS